MLPLYRILLDAYQSLSLAMVMYGAFDPAGCHVWQVGRGHLKWEGVCTSSLMHPAKIKHILDFRPTMSCIFQTFVASLYLNKTPSSRLATTIIFPTRQHANPDRCRTCMVAHMPCSMMHWCTSSLSLILGMEGSRIFWTRSLTTASTSSTVALLDNTGQRWEWACRPVKISVTCTSSTVHKIFCAKTLTTSSPFFFWGTKTLLTTKE